MPMRTHARRLSTRAATSTSSSHSMYAEPCGPMRGAARTGSPALRWFQDQELLCRRGLRCGQSLSLLSRDLQLGWIELQLHDVRRRVRRSDGLHGRRLRVRDRRQDLRLDESVLEGDRVRRGRRGRHAAVRNLRTDPRAPGSRVSRPGSTTASFASLQTMRTSRSARAGMPTCAGAARAVTGKRSR